MLQGLYFSAQGAQLQSLRQDVIANNLANAGTNGFKRDLVQAQAFLPQAAVPPLVPGDAALKCHAASRFLSCSPLPLALRPLPRPPSPWTPRLCLGVWGRGGWEVGLANSPLRFSRSLVGFLGFAFVFFGLECGKHDSASGVSPVPTTSMIHPLHLWSNDFMHDYLGG